MLLTATFLALAASGAAPPASAHHSGAMFDRTRVIEIRGVVKALAWTNPHASFKVEVPGSSGGEAQLWFIEMNGVSNLVQEGWKRTTIKPGDQVSVKVNPLRDGRFGGWYLSITLADGKTLGMGTGPAP
jgi:hypothetical protein